MTSASSMNEAGHPKPVLWDNPEGWGGERDGGRVHTCIPVAKQFTERGCDLFIHVFLNIARIRISLV